MKRIITFILFIQMISSIASANVIRNDYLSADLGGRATAMGSAFGAVADDSNAIFYNPAGISNLKNFSLLTSFGSVYNMANRTQMSLSCQAPVGTIGIGYVSLKVADLMRTDDTGNPMGRFSYGDSAYFVAYSIRPGVEWLSLGLTGKYLVKEFGAEQISGVGVDGGILAGNDQLSAGFTIQDLNNTKIGNDNYSRKYRLAVAARPIEGALLSCDYYDKAFYYGMSVNVMSLAQIQAGAGNGAITFGCSLNYEGVKVNAAYKKHDLGDSLMVELGL